MRGRIRPEGAEPLGAALPEASLPGERVDVLASHAEELIAELDASARLLYVNAASLALLGRDPDDLLGTRLVDLIHEDDRQPTAFDPEAIEARGGVRTIQRMRHRDGSWRWHQTSTRVVRSGTGEPRILVISRDVGAEKTTADALARQAHYQERLGHFSASLLSRVSHEIDEGIHELLPDVADLAGVDRVMLIVIGGELEPLHSLHRWERRGTPDHPPRHDTTALAHFRWSTERLTRGDVICIEDPSTLPAEAAPERRDLKERGVRSLLVIPLKTRRSMIGFLVAESVRRPARWLEADIAQLRLVGEIFAGAIKRRNTEQLMEVRRSGEQRVAALFRRFLVLGADDFDGAIDDALAEAAELAGADRARLYSIPEQESKRPEWREWCAADLPPFPTRIPMWTVNRIRSGDIVNIRSPESLPEDAEEERELMKRRGIASVLAIPVVSDERLVGYMVFESRAPRRWSDHDISLLRMIGELFTIVIQRRSAEEALRMSRAQLLQAQKLEAVGRLAGGIAHDFNNLLTVILGFSRPLLRELDEEHPIYDDVREINDSAERAALLTRQLLTFSRRQVSHSARIDVNQSVVGLEELIRRLLGEDIELLLELDADAGHVTVDPSQFEQVVMNVAVNARDAMPEGGMLRITTERRRIEPLVADRLGLSRPGDYTVVSAIDTGCGIDDETKEQIFDPFFTTKEPGKGTGLGLSIVYSVVEQAGGTVTVRGQPSKGATFEMYFPRVDGETWDEAETLDDDSRNEEEWVLLVEDEPAVRRLTRRILEGRGFRVLEAENGEQALELPNHELARVDVLLSDVVMPRMGGAQLARRLRSLRSDLKVLFMSGYPRERDGDEVTQISREAFLQKPFTESDLVDKLRELLDS